MTVIKKVPLTEIWRMRQLVMYPGQNLDFVKLDDDCDGLHLQYVMQWALDNNKKAIWCNARLSATNMYRKFGMLPTTETWKKYGLDFIKMEKILK